MGTTDVSKMRAVESIVFLFESIRKKVDTTHRLTETAIQCLKLYFILKILIGKYVKLLVRMPWVYILMG